MHTVSLVRTTTYVVFDIRTNKLIANVTKHNTAQSMVYGSGGCKYWDYLTARDYNYLVGTKATCKCSRCLQDALPVY